MLHLSYPLVVYSSLQFSYVPLTSVCLKESWWEILIVTLSMELLPENKQNFYSCYKHWVEDQSAGPCYTTDRGVDSTGNGTLTLADKSVEPLPEDCHF